MPLNLIRLGTPTLSEGQELDGSLILKVFRLKALYVRPSRPLLLAETDSSDDSCFEVDMPGDDRVCQSLDSVSENGENVTIDLNGQSTTQDSSSTRAQSPIRAQAFRSTVGAQPSTSDRPCTRPHSAADCWDSEQFSRSASWDGDYDTYISLIRAVSEDEEDDEDLCSAIMASIEDHEIPLTVEVSIKQILEELSTKINSNQNCKFNINRASVLDGAIRGFTRLSYNPNNRMVIRFSDDKGKFEEAVDPGGPRREFFRLLLVALMQSSMFEGKQGSLNLALDSHAIREDRYFIAGRAVAVSLVHGGPAPGCLSKTLFDSLVQGPDMCKPVLDDVADCELYNKIKKVSEATFLEELQHSTEPIMDYLANTGCVRPLKSIGDRDRLVEDILMFQVVNRVRGPFEKFRDGLKTLGILAKLQQHPEAFRSTFCHQPNQLTADILDDLFEIKWSENGSNKRANENRVIAFWRDYLQDVEEEGSQRLGAILAFATGSDQVPPIGFHPQPSIAFHHDTETPQRFPVANTCIICLRFPLYSTYSDFKSNMDFAIDNIHGFGKE
ncbi:G2/M phase-specific E3 ubiquitin-protein ligase-like [Triplophysa rosa]|uniref:G2/M phase-specific E3 ubiquitin-protein ligase-like n=1 Tax=Triplophysa rosa TaxID=992332 RepID=UPI002545FF53|nr:G2/M phase-specific E3 ubiquitin-protein ligase-like [Triplophysa rosa]